MLSEVFVNFIHAHLDDDLPGLLLAAHRYPDIPMQEAVAHIAALRKIRNKTPSWFRFDLVFPAVVSAEQASSERTAKFKAGLFAGTRMADLTGGMGVDTYFFSEHFKQVLYVEQNPVLAEAARYNFQTLGRQSIEVVHADAAQILQASTESFDLLYLDPARRDDRKGRVFQLVDCSPNVLEIKDLLFSKSPRVLLKVAPLLDIQLAVKQLGHVTRIWVVSVDNEVKELLLLLEKQDGNAPGQPFGLPDDASIPVEAVCLGDSERNFLFTRAEEKAALPEYAPPLQYLYEPDAAILKAGAFKLFATRFGLAKLHPDTHLYTSSGLVEDVPGRVFIIDSVIKYDRKSLLTALPEGKANVTVRNFPDSVDALRRKTGVADGGDRYVFGARLFNGRPALLVCRRVFEMP